MPRKPRTQELANGAISIRVEIPRAIWLVAAEMADEIHAKPDVGVRMFLRAIAGRFEAGDASFLGPEYQSALEVVRDRNFGVLNERTPQIDLSKLHGSTKVKSGYTGVYANGNGFRAVGRHPNGAGTKVLGTFRTAEEAAWRRYLYYRSNSLPYGPLEELREQWEKQGDPGAGGTTEQFLASARQFAQDTAQEHVYFPEEHPTAKPLASEADVYDTLAKAGIERVSR